MATAPPNRRGPADRVGGGIIDGATRIFLHVEHTKYELSSILNNNKQNATIGGTSILSLIII